LAVADEGRTTSHENSHLTDEVWDSGITAYAFKWAAVEGAGMTLKSASDRERQRDAFPWVTTVPFKISLTDETSPI